MSALSFDQVWTRADVGDVVRVSNGRNAPSNTASAEHARWRSHNFGGPLLAKIEATDARPRVLRICDADNLVARSASYDIAEGGAHTFALSERLDCVIDARLRELAARRWKAQAAFAYDGVSPIAYGSDTAGNLLAIIKTLEAAPANTTALWKLGRGEYRTWTLANLQAFASALLAYQSACFARESAIASDILEAETIEAVGGVDLESLWPAP